MKTRAFSVASNERGSTVVEVMIALIVLTTAVTALVASTGFSSRSLVTSRRDLQWWAALQWKADSLMAVDSASAIDGADSVNGYPMSWTVHPGVPTRVDVVVGGAQSILNDAALADTVVVYLRQ